MAQGGYRVKLETVEWTFLLPATPFSPKSNVQRKANGSSWLLIIPFSLIILQPLNKLQVLVIALLKQ